MPIEELFYSVYKFINIVFSIYLLIIKDCATFDLVDMELHLLIRRDKVYQRTVDVNATILTP